MNRLSKIKIFLGLVYLAVVTSVVIAFFYFGANTFLSPSYLIENKRYIFELRDQNLLLISSIYFIFSIIWVFLMGFGTPLVIFAGFAFGTVLGSFLSIFSFTIGATLLYCFANHYFKDLVEKYLGNKYSKLKNNINENELSYFFSLRVVPGIPFPIKNLLPVLFNMRKEFLFATLFGEAVPIIISISIFSGISSAFQSDKDFNLNLLFNPEIFFPLLALAIMSLVANYIKKNTLIKKMRFITFKKNNEIRAGLEIINKGIIDINKVNENLPTDLNNIIKNYHLIKDQIEKINKHQNIHYSMNEIDLLSPIPVPVRDIICVGKNYAEHAKEVQKSSFSTLQGKIQVPEEPIIFNKATTSVIGPNDKIELVNDRTNTTDYEGELGVIIGKRAKNIKYSNATDVIFGYTIINDVTARKLQNNHKQWFIGKSPDTYCPIGPSIVTKDEIKIIEDIKIQTFINGEIRQTGIVKDMIFNIPTIIETLTKSMTLVEGDIIATGTPSGVGIGFDPPKFLKSGDKVKISIDPIGILENDVI